jgi:hypothetical protein
MSRLLAATAESYLQGQTASALLLADTCQIAWWNKFLAPVVKTKAYKTYKKTGHYRQMKKLIAKPVISQKNNTSLTFSRELNRMSLFLNFDGQLV